MSISVGGLISGMDTDNIISQLLDIERKPILKLQSQEAGFQVKLSAFGNFKNSLEGVRTAARNLDSLSDFAGFSASSGNNELFTVVADNDAVQGSYSIKVNALATTHKLTSVAFSETGAVGEGTIHLQVGGEATVDIEIGALDTISDVADAINDSGAAVNAGVIFDGTNYYLTLAGEETGEDNVISLTVTESGTDPADPENLDTTGLSRLVFTGDEATGTWNLAQTQVAGDADFNIDGVSNIKRATNTVDDVIEGVTLTLKDAPASENTATLTVMRDNSLIVSNVKSLVSAYNSLLGLFENYQNYDQETGESGVLFGDSTTRQIRGQLGRQITNMVPDLSSNLNQIMEFGISANEDGKFEVDSGELNDKLDNNFDEAVQFFTRSDEGAEGFAVRMADTLDDILNTVSGSLTVRTKGIKLSIDDIKDQVANMEDRMSRTEERLRTQFTSLELLLGQYQNTSDSLNAQLLSLQNLSNYVSKRD